MRAEPIPFKFVVQEQEFDFEICERAMIQNAFVVVVMPSGQVVCATDILRSDDKFVALVKAESALDAVIEVNGQARVRSVLSAAA